MWTEVFFFDYKIVTVKEKYVTEVIDFVIDDNLKLMVDLDQPQITKTNNTHMYTDPSRRQFWCLKGDITQLLLHILVVITSPQEPFEIVNRVLHVRHHLIFRRNTENSVFSTERHTWSETNSISQLINSINQKPNFILFLFLL